MITIDRRARRLVWTVAVAVIACSWPAAAEVAVESALDSRVAELEEKLEKGREKHHVPGMAIAVVKDGEVILARGFGLANVEEETPATEKTLFAIGSSTKAFTATLAGMLVDEGKLAWDDPVTEHLPYFELPVKSDEEGAAATVRDLLAHRTGFSRMGILWAGGTAPAKDVLKTATRAEPVDGFRKNFHYNNVMYLAAGETIAKAGKKSWGKQIEKKIFAPLGMDDANHTYAAAQKAKGMALGYEWLDEEERWEHRPMRNLGSIAPAGAINAHVVDMAKWVAFQLDRGMAGDERILSEESLDETWSTQMEIGGGVTYGLGWMLREWEGKKVVEHGGNIDGFAAQVALLPEENLGFVLLTNVTATPLAQLSLPMVFGTILANEDDAAAEGDARSFDRYVGEYTANFGPFKEATFTVSVSDGKLAVDVPGQMNYTLKPPGEDGRRPFEITDQISVSFDENDGGEVVSLRMHQGGFDFDCPRKGLEIAPPIPLEELNAYLGRYASEGLGGEVEAKIRNNRLALDVPNQMVFELDPPDEEGRWHFRIRPELSVEFIKDESGRVVELTSYRGEEVQETMPRQAPAEGEQAEAGPALPTVEELVELCRLKEHRAVYDAGIPMRITSKIYLPNAGVEGRAVTWVDGDHRQRSEQTFGKFGEQVQVLDEDYAATESSFSPTRQLFGKELRIAHMEHMSRWATDWREKFDEVSVLGEGEVDDRKTWRVKLAMTDTPAAVIDVDAETGDIVAAESPLSAAGGAMIMTVKSRFEDFRDVNGLRMAHRIVSEVPQSGRTVSEIESIETGVEVEPSMFRVDI